MTNALRTAILIMASLPAISLHAQRVTLKDGDMSPLKGEKNIAVEFRYDSMAVGKFPKEADYVEKHKNDINKRHSPKGDEWAKNWVDDRQSRYEPKFLNTFTQFAPIQPGGKAKYTLILHTTFTEIGAGMGGAMFGVSKSAYINAEADIVESANKSHVIARIEIYKANSEGTWSGYDWDTDTRIEGCYGTAAIGLARFFRDKVQ